ncbi:hypothetical protein [Candidatus Nitrosacidococcus sp. I8]|uniref:hypothetical protein n=1 Tax=Candidatus Nitrosacidococcus sp. I8 TaxID=2942908 RepID=UPI002227B7AF|nr:hypothetical protein [Candidatus Nitrosacidococcus sp. I8]CAH9017607.1 hypothetical protein NURINAE_00454 [Candidatus Nitrosacidococcus sp. I8]
MAVGFIAIELFTNLYSITKTYPVSPEWREITRSAQRDIYHGTDRGNPYNVVFGHGRYGSSRKPITNMTLSEVAQFGRKVLIPNTKGRINAVDSKGNPLGTSAVGAYQLIQSNLDKKNSIAERVLKPAYGENWRRAKFTPEIQERLAKALYEINKTGIDLHFMWRGLPKLGVGRFSNVPWEKARLYILKGEIGNRQFEKNKGMLKNIPPLRKLEKIENHTLASTVQNTFPKK